MLRGLKRRKPCPCNHCAENKKRRQSDSTVSPGFQGQLGLNDLSYDGTNIPEGKGYTVASATISGGEYLGGNLINLVSIDLDT